MKQLKTKPMFLSVKDHKECFSCCQKEDFQGAQCSNCSGLELQMCDTYPTRDLESLTSYAHFVKMVCWKTGENSGVRGHTPLQCDCLCLSRQDEDRPFVKQCVCMCVHTYEMSGCVYCLCICYHSLSVDGGQRSSPCVYWDPDFANLARMAGEQASLLLVSSALGLQVPVTTRRFWCRCRGSSSGLHAGMANTGWAISPAQHDAVLKKDAEETA